MNYLGGKWRIGRAIALAIKAHTTKRTCYVEPFLGGGSSFYWNSPHFKRVLIGDLHKPLIMMYQEAANGWKPSTIISAKYYNLLKRSSPSHIQGFIGFSCSYAGKWFGGYDPRKIEWGRRSLIKVARRMPPNVAGEIRNCSYTKWDDKVTRDCVVYCDPPYASTTGYTTSINKEVFWNLMGQWSRRGAAVFVSEYGAPEDWTCIWQSVQLRSFGNGKTRRTIEKLFTLCA